MSNSVRLKASVGVPKWVGEQIASVQATASAAAPATPAAFGDVVAAASIKADPYIDDAFAVSDSENSDILRRVKWSRLQKEARSQSRKPWRFSGKVLVNGNTATGWTVFSGTTLAVVAKPTGGPAEYRTDQNNCLRITTDALYKSVTINVTTGPVKVPRVDVWIYVEDHTKITGITFFFATSDAFSAYYQVIVTPRSQLGWQVFSLNLATATVVGSPTYETITRFRMGITASSTAGCSFIFDRATIGAHATSKCALIWDDGNVSCYTHTIPLLNKHRLIGNFALYDIPSRIEQYRMMSHSGHRLLVHGNFALNTYGTIALAQQDILDERQFVEGLGGPGIDSDVYVYPNGVYNYSANNLALPEFLRDNGFVGAYATDENIICPEVAQGLRPYLLQRLYLDATTVAATFLSKVDQYMAIGACFATVAHVTVDSGATGYDVNLQVLDDILAGLRTRINAGSMECVSARELILQLTEKP